MSKRDQREGEGWPLPFTQPATYAQPGLVYTPHQHLPMPLSTDGHGFGQWQQSVLGKQLLALLQGSFLLRPTNDAWQEYHAPG